MPADAPTIVATSGGHVMSPTGRRRLDVGPLLRHAVDLSGVHGRAPRICHVGTAIGDQRWMAAELEEADRAAGFLSGRLNLFPMPNCRWCSPKSMTICRVGARRWRRPKRGSRPSIP